MAHAAVLSIQFTIMVMSVLFNSFGIFTFHKRNKGNKNQHLLLQNLAAVEVVKILYDILVLLLYYFCNGWYIGCAVIFMVLEANVMTTLYLSFVAVTTDRLLCVILEGKYARYVTRKSVSVTIASIWLVTTVPGVIIWALFPVLHKAKMYYYIAWDVLVVVLIVPTYAVVVNMIWNGTRKSTKEVNKTNHKNHKSVILGILLTLSFIAFNLVPDVVVMVHGADQITYYIIAVTWSTGYLVDPLIYIFASKDSRRVAKSSVKKMTQSIGEKFSITGASTRGRAATEIYLPEMKELKKKYELALAADLPRKTGSTRVHRNNRQIRRSSH